MDQITELVRRVLEGDTQAFEIIYQNTYRQIYYTCMSFLKNEQNVYDVMQDTYITALTRLGQLQNPDRLVAWLNQIAVNRCRDFLRKRQPEQLPDELTGTELVENNDNFLPESYVISEEKRKKLLDIMQEELSAVQYQTIILYYFDGMSISEIAECMQCPEGTVTYRLSTARGRIKKGVQAYENLSGQKLYSSGGITLLTAVFYAETQNLVVPNVLTKIFAAVMGTGATAGAVTATGSVASAVAGTSATATSAGVTSAAGTGASAAAGTGAKVLFATTKAKVTAGIVTAAVVAGGAAGVVALTHKNDTDTSKDGGYKEVNIQVVDDEYLNVTITKIYDKGYIPDECRNLNNQTLDESYWSANDCIVEYQVENKTDENVYLDIRFMTGNNEAFDYDREVAVTWLINPEQKAVNYMNNHGIPTEINVGRDPIEWAKTEAIVYIEGDNGADLDVVDYVLEDFDFYGNGTDKTYKRTVTDDREQVLVDNDDVRITFIGAERNTRPIFYAENKSGRDLRVKMLSDYVGEDTLDMPAGTTGYFTMNYMRDREYDENAEATKAAMADGTPIPINIIIQDYSELGGSYINFKSYYREPDYDTMPGDNGHRYLMDVHEKMQDTERTYTGEFTYFLIDEK